MKLISRLREPRYCAFCKGRRQLYVKKHVDLTNVGGSALLSLLVSDLLWSQPDPRALILFCLLLVGGEILVYLRWRLALTCKMCGFDPVLYKRSPMLANQQVRKFFSEQIEKPEFMLGRSPLLALQRKIRKQERKTAERGLIRPSAKPVAASSLAPQKTL